MPKSKARLLILITWIAVIATGVLSFAVILTHNSDRAFSRAAAYAVYALIALTALLSFLYSARCPRTAKALCFEGCGRGLPAACALCCVGMLYDFVHQCYNCYDYFENVGYVEKNYIIPIAISGFFALLSAGYFIAVFLTVKQTGVDYRNFTAFHFAPLLWAFFKIFTLITGIFDVSKGSQDICNFILLVALIAYFMLFALASEKKAGAASKGFIASSVFAAAMCFTVAVPRMLAAAIGLMGNLENTTVSSPTYFVLGLFIVFVLRENRRCERNGFIGE